MPWRHTSPMDQNIQVIADYLRRTRSITEWCALYGVSRQTGYKWSERALTSGPPGLEDHSRTPCSRPKQTPQHVVEALIAVRCRHPSWGAKTLVSILHNRHPNWSLPGRSTVCDILRRHGLVPKKRYHRHLGHPGKPTTLIAAPHEVWSADVTGQLTTGDGRYCDPLTVADGYRRLLLGGQALSSTRVAEAKPVFTRLFKECGLPTRIRTDNGVPCATNTLGRLSPLSAWWVRLGLCPEGIEPGKPQQNGRHERMHRTLQAETTRPPALGGLSSARLSASVRSSTASARTRRSTCAHPPPAMLPPPVRCPPDCHRWKTPTVSRCAMSVPTVASGGISKGATCHTPALANMSASRTSMMASGLSTSARSHTTGCANAIGVSKMPMVNSNDAGDCDPCLRTFL
jgi:putative transposase